MRAVFMGSADLSCPSLQMLMDSKFIDLVAVVSQPDRAHGRGRKVLRVCPTKQLAVDNDVDVLTPENVNTPEFLQRLSDYSPDVIVVVAYGQILRAGVLNSPSLGCVNLHTSLLPAYRGAAPIQWAIANGETITGVTTMFMDEGMDSGEIIAQREVAIDSTDTAGTMHDKMGEIGAALLIETLQAVADGTVKSVSQDTGKVTLAPKLSRAHGKIDWALPAESIECRARGFNPVPGCWTHFDPVGRLMNDDEGKLLKIWKAEVVGMSGSPGEVLDVTGVGPVVAAGMKALRLIEVQPEGGKVMSGSDYIRGHMGSIKK